MLPYLKGLGVIVRLAIIWFWLSLAFTHVPLEVDREPDSFFRTPVEWLFVRNDSGSPIEEYRKTEKYRKTISLVFIYASIMCPIAIALVTVVGSILKSKGDKKRFNESIAEIRREYDARLETEKDFQIRPIIEEGKDDIATMIEILADATRAIIFAGRYDWLLLENKLRDRVRDLASTNQVVLVSYQPQGAVAGAMRAKGADGTHFYNCIKHRVVEESDHQFLLTVAWQPGEDTVVCTRVRTKVGTGNPMHDNVLIRKLHSDHSSAIVGIIEKLCNFNHWAARCSAG